MGNQLFFCCLGAKSIFLGRREEEEEEEEEKEAEKERRMIHTKMGMIGREREKTLPNQQRTLHKLPTELRCRNFVTKHRLSIQICAKRAKNVCATCICTNGASIFHTTVGGWVREEEEKSSQMDADMQSIHLFTMAAKSLTD